MPLFDMDPNTAANLVNFGGSMMQAGGQPGASFAGAAGAGVQGMQTGKLQRQQLMAAQMQNQMGQLNLQRAQAMQPMVMNQINGMTQGNGGVGATGGNSASAGGGPASAYAQQALMAAYASGNQEQISKAYLSLYEHDPALAGQIKAEQEGNTLFKTPEGEYKKGKDMGGGNTPAPSAGQPRMASAGGSINPPATTAVKSDNSAPDDNAQTNVMPNAVTNSSSRFPTAADGKPIISGYPRLIKPDPSGLPQYKPASTESGVALKKEIQSADIKANSEFNSSLGSLQTEKFRIQELAKIYEKVQAGTMTAQNPEFFNKMAALGFKDDPKSIEDLGGIQGAMQNHLLQLVNQYKDTNNAMGEAPTRMFGGVLSALIEHGENPGNQPGGLHTVLGEALGAVNHHIDMLDGWNTIGGLGNRVADGYTMRPDDFVRNWSLGHKISDYNDMAQKEMKPFKGMEGNKSDDKVVDLTKYKNPKMIGQAYQLGEITKDQATMLLQKNHGMQ